MKLSSCWKPIVLCIVLLTAGLAFIPATDAQTPAARKRLLVVTHTAGFRHGSIPVARETLKELGERTGLWEVEYADSAAEVEGLMTGEQLKRFDAVVFANTTGELPVTEEGKRAFLEWLRGGKAFIGMHSATDTFYRWPEFGKLIGGYFDGHPWHQKVTVKVEDTRHPATRHLGTSFEVTDEIYQFKEWSREGKHVLLSIDNNSIDASKGKRADNDYAVAWTRQEGKGRVFYTSLGHRDEVWRDPRFQQHLIGGITWAMQASSLRSFALPISAACARGSR